MERSFFSAWRRCMQQGWWSVPALLVSFTFCVMQSEKKLDLLCDTSSVWCRGRWWVRLVRPLWWSTGWSLSTEWVALVLYLNCCRPGSLWKVMTRPEPMTVVLPIWCHEYHINRTSEPCSCATVVFLLLLNCTNWIVPSELNSFNISHQHQTCVLLPVCLSL